MRRLARWGATALLVLSFCGGPPAAQAARRRPPAPPPPGWDLDRVRFEPLEGSAPLGAEGVGEYRGALEVARSGGGVAVVNDLDLEAYLLGISEVPASWPAEAQKAQAIAARTYALHEIGRKTATAHRAVGADICATDACQVYAGLAKERREGSRAWAAAVEATAGQVILYKGEPILAKYSSSNGGHTVAGGKPYLKAVADPDDARSPLHRWSTSVPVAAVGSALGIVHEISTARREGDSVVLGWTDHGEKVESLVPVGEFRSRVNAAVPAPEGLPSAVPSVHFDLTADPAGAVVRIQGRGWGHGIGMSQFGALAKALKGRRAAEILAFYYGGLKPSRLPPERVPSSVRVAVGLGQPQAKVGSPGGRFRVVDGDANVVVPVATGTWRVSPARRAGVRVMPPPEQVAPLSLETMVDRVEPGPEAVTVALRLSAPAVLRLLATPPGGEETALEAEVVDGGEVHLRLPPAAAPGQYSVVIEADGGPGRSASVPVTFPVGPDADGSGGAAPAGSGATEAATGPGSGAAGPQGGPTAAAFALLVMVADRIRRARRNLAATV